jgi:glycosyltransferase involved in cell wall biosynthesis
MMRSRLAPHVLHVFPTFEPGGQELRAAGLINALGPRFRHTIVALDGNVGALAAIQARGNVGVMEAPPGKGSALYGLAWRGVLRRSSSDLVATYGWGAIDAVVGQFGRADCPTLHNESGFLVDEACSLNWRRVLARRILLRSVYATVVVSRTMQEIALRRFGLPSSRVVLIPNGVDLARFTPIRDLSWRKARQVPGAALLIGTVAGLRPEKDQALLIRAFAAAHIEHGWLALVGDGPCRGDLERLAQSLGVAGRVVFAGHTPEPERALAAFDIFALSSSTEQMPNALLQAMACGLPVVCTDVGDCSEMLGSHGFPSIVPAGDQAAFSAALAQFAQQAEQRQLMGAANRDRCQQRYPLERSLASHAALYERALAQHQAA